MSIMRKRKAESRAPVHQRPEVDYDFMAGRAGDLFIYSLRRLHSNYYLSNTLQTLNTYLYLYIRLHSKILTYTHLIILTIHKTYLEITYLPYLNNYQFDFSKESKYLEIKERVKKGKGKRFGKLINLFYIFYSVS